MYTTVVRAPRDTGGDCIGASYTGGAARAILMLGSAGTWLPDTYASSGSVFDIYAGVSEGLSFSTVFCQSWGESGVTIDLGDSALGPATSGSESERSMRNGTSKKDAG